MRTKMLVYSAAVLAAGIATSMAQVYSVNVVGYVNKTIPADQFVLLANPLDDGTNSAASLLAALPNKSTAQAWNGTGFTGVQKVGGVWPALSVPVGAGVFVRTPATAGTVTNTFVGSVIVGFGQTNTMNLPGQQFSLVGSPVPFSGTLTDAGPNTINLGNALPNKSTVQIWNGTGFTGVQKVGGAWSPNLSIAVGDGFFVFPNAATSWSQILQ